MQLNSKLNRRNLEIFNKIISIPKILNMTDKYIHNMDTFECILKRRSVRRFLEVPVEMEKIGKILEAGMSAPSAGNLQNWAFILVKDPANRQGVAQACLRQMWIASAPVVIVVCTQLEKGTKFYGLRGERLYNIQNCAAAAQNIMLAATQLGLGSCWVGAFEEEMLSRVCGIPAEARPQVVIPIGYPAEEPRLPPRHLLEKVAFLEKYNSRIKDVLGSALGFRGHKVQATIGKAKEVVAKMHKKLKKE